MSELHIAEIGDQFANIDGFDFLSNQNMLEYDFIVIDIDSLTQVLNDGWKSRIEPRFAELREFVARKNIPVVFFCSNTGKFNPKGVQEKVDIYKMLDLDVAEEKTEGQKIEINSNSLFTNFLNTYIAEFEYQIGFPKHPGSSVGNAKFKNISIGFYTKDFVFLPSLTEEGNDIDEADFFNDLYQICRNIRKGDEVTIVPDWTNEYLLPGEKDERDTLNKLEAEIERLTKEKSASEIRLSSYLPMKQLWSATGSTLENSAKMVFEELGFTLLHSEANRDDIIMTIGDQTVIVEVKGVTKSAGEKNAAQLEKWLSTYLADNEIKAKGILLVNAFRELPLDDRTQDAFPSQMIPYSTQRNQCLVTTLQLSSLLLYCRQNPQEKDNVIQDLIGTVGVYEKFNNWQQYIDHPKISKGNKKTKIAQPSNTKS